MEPLSLLAVALVLVAGNLAYGMAMPIDLVGFFAALVLGLLSMYGISLLLAAWLPNPRIATGIGWAVFFPLGFSAGVWVPRAALPDVISKLGDVTPLGAFREAIQAAWVDTGVQPVHLIAMAVAAVLTIAAAVRWFRWQ